jgi:hypothetical protein
MILKSSKLTSLFSIDSANITSTFLRSLHAKPSGIVYPWKIEFEEAQELIELPSNQKRRLIMGRGNQFDCLEALSILGQPTHEEQI